jgi:hypothetical protein
VTVSLQLNDAPLSVNHSRKAIKGALKKLFSFSLDGAAATEHCGVVGEVIHIIGDDRIDSKLVEKESY